MPEENQNYVPGTQDTTTQEVDNTQDTPPQVDNSQDTLNQEPAPTGVGEGTSEVPTNPEDSEPMNTNSTVSPNPTDTTNQMTNDPSVADQPAGEVNETPDADQSVLSTGVDADYAEGNNVEPSQNIGHWERVQAERDKAPGETLQPIQSDNNPFVPRSDQPTEANAEGTKGSVKGMPPSSDTQSQYDATPDTNPQPSVAVSPMGLDHDPYQPLAETQANVGQPLAPEPTPQPVKIVDDETNNG